MDEAIRRRDAKKLGMKFYFTGIPCSRGHVAKRYTSTFKCIVCSSDVYSVIGKQKKVEKYKTNQDYAQKARDRSNAYRLEVLKDKEKHAQLKAKKAAYARLKKSIDPAYAERQRALIRISGPIWKKNNPEKHRSYIKARKAMMRSYGYIKAATIREIISEQKNKCNCCGANISSGNYHLDHILPLKLGGTNDRSNLQGLCSKCNLHKAAKHPDVWAKEMENRYGR